MYQVAIDEGTMLPMTVNVVREKFYAGSIQPYTKIWREGLDEWVTVAQIADELELEAHRPKPQPQRAPRPTPPLPPSNVAAPVERVVRREGGVIDVMAEIFLLGAGILTCLYFGFVFSPAREGMLNLGLIQDRALGFSSGALMIICSYLNRIARR